MANAIVGIVGSQVQGDKVLPGSIWVFSSPSINLDPPSSKKSRDPLSNSHIVCDPPELLHGSQVDGGKAILQVQALDLPTPDHHGPVTDTWDIDQGRIQKGGDFVSSE